MWPAIDLWRSGAMALDAMLAASGTPESVRERQERRLAELLAAARRAPYWRARLARHAGASVDGLAPVTKRELMQHFDACVADPRITLAALRAFLADPARIGQPFLERYHAWESSGSSGEPGVFVHDAQAIAVYDALEGTRRGLREAPWWDAWGFSDRIAFVGATGGHFAATVSVERLRRLVPGAAARLQGFSFLEPVDRLSRALERWRPSVLVSYPSTALLLAEEALAGRLRLDLRQVWTGGETLSARARARIAQGFGCGVADSYGASEFLPIAAQCRAGALHVNADWVLVEPVDAHGRPVAPGERSHRCWLTNLANHVQPLIRYQLEDRVRLKPSGCSCGSPLPVIEVEGRSDDLLLLRDTHGHAVRLAPLALTTVLEDEAGVFDFRIVQRDAHSLKLTLAQPRADGPALERARDALSGYLREQGLAGVRVEAASAAASERGRTGKVKRVVGCAPT